MVYTFILLTASVLPGDCPGCREAAVRPMQAPPTSRSQAAPLLLAEPVRVKAVRRGGALPAVGRALFGRRQVSVEHGPLFLVSSTESDPVGATALLLRPIPGGGTVKGSATIIGPRRSNGRWWVLSASHCAAHGADRNATITLKDGRRLKLLLLSWDPYADVCWYTTNDATLDDLPSARLASRTPEVGAKVWHVGYGIDQPTNRESGKVVGAADGGRKVELQLSVSMGDSGCGIFALDSGEVACVTSSTNRPHGGDPHASTFAGTCVAAMSLLTWSGHELAATPQVKVKPPQAPRPPQAPVEVVIGGCCGCGQGDDCGCGPGCRCEGKAKVSKPAKKSYCDCERTKICDCGPSCACPACEKQAKAGIPFAGTKPAPVAPRAFQPAAPFRGFAPRVARGGCRTG